LIFNFVLLILLNIPFRELNLQNYRLWKQKEIRCLGQRQGSL